MNPKAPGRLRTAPSCLVDRTGDTSALANIDLLQQNSSYLEANWIALETGNLAFTVNLNGACTWADGYLENGFIPGMLDQPLFRLVIDKTCLVGGSPVEPQADQPDARCPPDALCPQPPDALYSPLQWDVSAWTEGRLQDHSGFPWTVARVIRHTSQSGDLPGILPFSNRLPAGQWRRQGAHLLALAEVETVPGQTFHQR